MVTKLKPDVRQFEEIASLPASSKKVIGHMDVENVRTLTVTCKGTVHASATLAIRVNVYYSPTGERADWDSTPFATFDLTVDVGNNTQETLNIDPPRTGSVKIEIENLDSGQAATFIQTWASVKRFEYEDVVEAINNLNESIEKNFHIVIGKIVKK